MSWSRSTSTADATRCSPLRADGAESNHLPLVIRPQLIGPLPVLVPGGTATLTARALLDGAAAELGGDSYRATVDSPTSLTFEVPETAELAGAEFELELVVVNPDG